MGIGNVESLPPAIERLPRDAEIPVGTLGVPLEPRVVGDEPFQTLSCLVSEWDAQRSSKKNPPGLFCCFGISSSKIYRCSSVTKITVAVYTRIWAKTKHAVI